METLSINQPWLNCEKCTLRETRCNVVLGQGNIQADVFFLGQSPGKAEDATGVPWSGPAGIVFNSFLKRFGWSLENTFSDNALGCAPYVYEEGKGRYKLSKPTNDQLVACKDRIYDAIYEVDPHVVVALGEVAYKTLTGVQGKKIAQLRKEVFTVKIPGVVKYVTYPLIVTYNPAALISQAGKPIGHSGGEEQRGTHKKKGSLWDRFFEDINFIYTHIALAKQLEREERNQRK